MEQTTLDVNAGYRDLLEWAGLTVMHAETFGEWQGDYLFAVKRHNHETDRTQYGIAVVGYGSCSGCDALESARTTYGDTWAPGDYATVTNLARSLADNVHWGTREQLQKHLYDGPASLYQWYRHEKDYEAKLANILVQIPTSLDVPA